MRPLIITNSVTSRDEKSLEKYLVEISRYEVLNPEQESALFKRFADGDKKALSEIILHNLRFVVSVAKQYQHTGLRLGDLINEGNIGLMKAAHRFDVTRGFKFISYAVWWIRQSIIQALNEKGRNIRLPSNHQSNATKIIKAETSFLQKFERKPSIHELAEATGLEAKVVQKCLETYKKCRSLDAPIKADDDMTLARIMKDYEIPAPDFKLAVRESQKQEVNYLLNKLPAREATVLSLYFGIERKHPMSLSDIGEHVGVTRERARQIKDKGLRKLRRRHYKKAVAF
jgi:RNA polymerase primary sigma factor